MGSKFKMVAAVIFNVTLTTASQPIENTLS